MNSAKPKMEPKHANLIGAEHKEENLEKWQESKRRLNDGGYTVYGEKSLSIQVYLKTFSCSG